MKIENQDINEKTNLLNEIESIGGPEKIKELMGDIKCKFDSVENGTSCLVTVYLGVENLSPSLHVFALDALSKLKTVDVEHIGTNGSSRFVSICKKMSENYLKEDLQEKFKESMEMLVLTSFKKELKALKYEVNNFELIGSGKLFNSKSKEETGFFNKLMRTLNGRSNEAGLNS